MANKPSKKRKSKRKKRSSHKKRRNKYESSPSTSPSSSSSESDSESDSASSSDSESDAYNKKRRYSKAKKWTILVLKWLLKRLEEPSAPDNAPIGHLEARPPQRAAERCGAGLGQAKVYDKPVAHVGKPINSRIAASCGA